ncbi:hypothetical protein Y1Q_0006517 [Alligator mississippiensis]|uniref:Reverse transcriptase domain-containing protein n=1 Tax=Alligator mississippiensis TaxID=8496 RepID=A0A151M3W3_ALLMI|nr:hypothetical protein Y1Q_0006517 [Alligator mississippiensis]
MVEDSQTPTVNPQMAEGTQDFGDGPLDNGKLLTPTMDPWTMKDPQTLAWDPQTVAGYPMTTADHQTLAGDPKMTDEPQILATSDPPVATQGETHDIPIQAGVKQGCPLSPNNFNVAMELLLNAMVEGPGGLRLYRWKLSILACTDNIIFLASDPKKLQKMLDISSEEVEWMRLCFNASNCAFLHVNCRKKSTGLDSTVTIQGKQTKCLRDSKSYLHLRMPTSHWVKQMLEETIHGRRYLW